MANEEEIANYISDYVVAILKSPTWVSPVSKFVDDNCGIFEDAEENKLEYTLIHNAFRQLVDDLLVAHLAEMSITTEQFMIFCQRGLSGNNELHRELVEQLISCDDFLVFKAMMVKRCCELNREVLGAPCSIVALASPVCPTDHGLSQQLQPVTDAEEAERLEAERRCVEAELQLAEALSLQLEKRLQLMEALDEVLELVSKIYKLRADALEQQIAEERDREHQLTEAPLELQAALDQAAGLELPREPLPPLKPVQQQLLAPVISSTVSVRPLHSAPLQPLQPALLSEAPMGPNEILALERKKAEVAAHKERAERASAVKRQELSRVGATVQSYDNAPMYHPQHGLISPPMTQEASSLSAVPVTTVVSNSLEPTPEEKAARAEHLKRQRESLVARKNQERQNNLSAFQMQNGVTQASNVAQHKIYGTPCSEEAGKQLARELSGEVQGQQAPVAAHAESAALEMRRMLTRQLKASFQ